METSTQPVDAARRSPSPGQAIMLLGIGHAAWGVAAYHRPLRKLARAGVVDSVGDGVFRRDHAADDRAAAFWFTFSAPLIVLSGYLAEAALKNGDDRTVEVAGRAVLGIAAVGAAVIPRSGFPVALPIGYWLMRQGRRRRAGR